MSDSSSLLFVLDLIPPKAQASKPQELIQVTGHQTLSLAARRAITILWHNAHRQGIQENKSYTIQLSELRSAGSHDNAPVEEAIIALMQTILTVKIANGRTRRVQFLGGNDLDDPDRLTGTLTYNFDKFLIEILRDSRIWGKISLSVIMALSSKYAISFYENVAQCTGLSHKSSEVFTVEQLRLLLGVEETKYPAFGALNKHVLKPAVQEINALAPFSIEVMPMKTGRKVTHVKAVWSIKDKDDAMAAWKELNRSKIGRRMRINQTEERIVSTEFVDNSVDTLVEKS